MRIPQPVRYRRHRCRFVAFGVGINAEMVVVGAVEDSLAHGTDAGDTAYDV